MATTTAHQGPRHAQALAPQRHRAWLMLSASLLTAATAIAQTVTDSLHYDERGNIIQRIMGGRVIGYRYDGLDRLREETAPGNQRFMLDADGNRLADGRSVYRVAPGGHRLADRDGVALVHGPTGHLLVDRAWVGGRWVQRGFDWTLDGQIKTVRLDGVAVATYHYNEARQRTRKTLAAPPAGVPAVTLYRHDPAGRLTLEVAGSGAQAQGVAVAPGQVLARYIWQDAVPIAVVWPPMTSGNPNATTDRIVYLHADHLNAPRRATDARGVVVWQWISDAFGASPPEEDPDQDGLRTTIHLRFPGQYFDAESGLHYNWHRYYDPQVGRYTQSDPIGLAGGINTYAYVWGNPVSYVDPDGLRGGAVRPQLTYNPGIQMPGPQPAPTWNFMPSNPFLGRQTGMQLIADSIGNLDFRTPSNVNWGNLLPGPPVPPGCTVISAPQPANMCTANSTPTIVCGPVIGPRP